jgi:tRNA threonylcarbamoyladenosine biosynthesis protein TsaE
MGRMAQRGWVLGLTGGLGTGKTQFARGLARGLGIPSRIQSPTFALVHEHRSGRLPLFHLDLCRLDTLEQILAAGLGDYFSSREGVTVVEWYERWTGPPPPVLIEVRLHDWGDQERLIEYDPPRS